MSAAVTPWNPGTDGVIQGMTILGTTIYIGGFFHAVGGLPRDFLAAVDRSGNVTPWAPDAFAANGDARVQALAAMDSTVFAGGFFAGVSGEPREYFAAMDSKTAAVRRSWPTPDGPVWSLAASNGDVYLGGGFRRVGSWPINGFAAIRLARQPSPVPSDAVALSQCAPNPVIGSTTIRYTLPIDARVDLTVYDLLGRIVSRVISRTWQTAGPHEVMLSTTGWRPGCYLYQLDAGGRAATRKLVVLQ